LPTIIRRIGPDVIITAAAFTAVDKAEQQQELAFTVNGASVGTIAEEARKASALLIHYSAEYASGMGACSDPLRGGDIRMKGY